MPEAIASVGHAWHWFLWFLHDQAALWVTAAATVFLYIATSRLTRATNIEHALNGPFIVVTLNLEAPAAPGAENPRTPAYVDVWGAQDAAEPFLSRQNATSAPQYVVITIANGQTKTQGVANKVKVVAQLLYGAPDDVAPHPYTLNRTVVPVPLHASGYAEGPLFNVGGLPNFIVRISSVEYYDIMNRRRTAAVGTEVVRRIVSGKVFQNNQVFEPRKGEFTDGD